MLTVGSNVAPSHPSSVVRLPSSNPAFQPRLCDLGHSRSARIAGFTSTNGTFEPDCVIQSTAGALELNDTASSHDPSVTRPSARSTVSCSIHPQPATPRCHLQCRARAVLVISG